MHSEKIVLETIDKSFLRTKWESILKKIIIRRIPIKYSENDQVIYLNSENELKIFFSKSNSEKLKKVKIIVILIPLNNFINLIKFLDTIDKILDEDTKIIINYFSVSWKYIFNIFSFLGLIKNFKKSLFFSKKTFDVFLNCTNYESSKKLNDISLPFEIPLLTKLLSILVNIFPFLSLFSFANIFYLRKRVKRSTSNELMSLIIPCKNEAENIKNIISEAKIKLNFKYQLVFVDDLSEDQTKKNILQAKIDNPETNIKVLDGVGKGKSRAVDIGVKNSDGFYCAILDADLTVKMEDLNSFYSAISIGNGDLINGTRLVYKLEDNSMRFLNILGNKFFSYLITYITSSNISDTLCGTKCFKKSDWEIFEEFRLRNKLNDIWGDFNIIFASSFYGYKLIDLPVRYYERITGETKMKRRFYYFINMLKLCYLAFLRFKINYK
ncbi:glycosyltransferase family 2 protein [Candidatus Pelagibacter bacterium nBUS_44]|uniref:glycosyltransferase family 2 protein n=1 Tax=Candidatus Pelagibacter bacterium nBUS_44 TaxID=3374195 RepID=UPI003EBB5141